MDDKEYELKKAELALREREVSTKENEGKISKWFNPLTIAIYVAAVGLFGNIYTNYSTNRASEEAEHFRAQSSLVLSVIKTNGNEDGACKNLNFFVQIGWLDDPNGTIHTRCGTRGENGVPTLPASSLSQFDQPPPGVVASGQPALTTLTVRVEDTDSHRPIPNAEIQQLASANGGAASRSVSTDAEGSAILNFVTSQDKLIVSKRGYETVTQSMSQLGMNQLALASQRVPTITIDLRQTPATKH